MNIDPALRLTDEELTAVWLLCMAELETKGCAASPAVTASMVKIAAALALRRRELLTRV